jgi:hypothetical protein
MNTVTDPENSEKHNIQVQAAIDAIERRKVRAMGLIDRSIDGL